MLFSLLESEGNAVNAQKTNQGVMEALARQKFGRAQKLFFENARKNPSYQTFNNLGYYLITEGLECKNGKVRNAYRLGFSYLLKSRASHPSFTNSCAIAFALSHFAEGAVQGESHGEEDLYAAVLDALSLGYSDTMQYNLLRLQFGMKREGEDFLSQVRELASRFPCEESASLYLEAARTLGRIEEGMRCLRVYGDLIDAPTRLLFLASVKEYEAGYSLSQEVAQWCLRSVDIASIVECCLQTDRQNRIGELLSKDRLAPAREDAEHSRLVDQLLDPYHTEARRSMMKQHREIPPFLSPCCFFGCPSHQTDWE